MPEKKEKGVLPRIFLAARVETFSRETCMRSSLKRPSALRGFRPTKRAPTADIPPITQKVLETHSEPQKGGILFRVKKKKRRSFGPFSSRDTEKPKLFFRRKTKGDMRGEINQFV